MFNLPEPSRYRLGNPPLVLAVAQATYPIQGRLASLEGITPIQDQIRQTFPYMGQVQIDQLAFVVGPAGAAAPPQTSRSTSWRFTDDSGWTADVGPSSTSLAVGRSYETVDEMSTRFSLLLRGLHESGGVPRCDRLGVRFIDIVPIAPGEHWAEWFRPEIVGWIDAPILAPDSVLQMSLNQSTLGAPLHADGFDLQLQSVIRHGLLPAGTEIPAITPERLDTPGFILDIDVAAIGPQPFDQEALLARSRLLHQNIDSFFRWCLSPQGEAHFELQEL